MPPAKSECPRRFWRCSLTHAPTLGYVNVISDNYLGKTQPCIPTVMLGQVLADAVVWRLESTESVFCQGFAPDPVGELITLPQTP